MPKNTFTDRRDDTAHKDACRRNGVPYCTPRRSGLTRADLALLGKGFMQGLRPFTRAEADEYADRRGLGRPRGRADGVA